LLEFNSKSRKWKGLILTGSEITLRGDLTELAQRARQSGFDHVRIQTHGMHLAQESFCRKLIESGVDEFFVSVAGADAETHDAITEVDGSFERTIRGLENIDKFDNVISITNTVVTSRSYRLLPAIVDRLSHLKNLAQMEFWVYFPMQESDDKDLVVSHRDVLPVLKQAIHAARARGLGVEVKNFPECMLGEDADTLLNSQPQLYIDPSFWTEFMRNGFYQCVYREQCDSTECLGLNTAYIEKFGWEKEVLHPLQGSMSAKSRVRERPSAERLALQTFRNK